MTQVTINLDEILEKIDQYKRNIAEAKFVQKQNEQELEKEELRLQAVCNQLETKEMNHGVYTFGWFESKRKAFDQKLFGEEHPDLLEQYKVEKTTEKFEVKINK